MTKLTAVEGHLQKGQPVIYNEVFPNIARARAGAKHASAS